MSSTRPSVTAKSPMTASKSGLAQKGHLSTSPLQPFALSSAKSPRASFSPSAHSTIPYGCPSAPWYALFFPAVPLFMFYRLVPSRRATALYSNHPNSRRQPAASLLNSFPNIWTLTLYASSWEASLRRPRYPHLTERNRPNWLTYRFIAYGANVGSWCVFLACFLSDNPISRAL